MASSHRNRTPSALEPYLALPPEHSLVLLTNTLGCSANWLTSRIAAAGLNDESNNISVVLVSWMRDLAFWKDELRRAAVGLHKVDIAKNKKRKEKAICAIETILVQ